LAFNLLTVAEIGKRGQTQINTDNLIVDGERVSVTLAGEAGVPVAQRITTNRQRFDLATNRTMQFNLYGSDLGKREFVAIQTEPLLLEGETIVQPFTLETRVAWLDKLASRSTLSLSKGARFDTPKESLVRKFNAFLNILQNLRMDFTKRWIRFFPDSQQFVRVIQGQTFVRFLVGIFANTQRIVVDPTTNLKRSFKLSSLGSGWVQAILVGQSHAGMITDVTLTDNYVTRLDAKWIVDIPSQAST